MPSSVSVEKRREYQATYRAKIGEERWHELERAATVRYRERNREKLREKNRAWRNVPENREKASEASKRWYASHREEALAKDKARYHESVEVRQRQRELRLQRNYGLSVEDYDKMMDVQERKCPLDGREFGNGGLRPVIDHNHVTNAVRGILHDECNRMLGLLEKKPELQNEKIKAYLARFP